MARKLGLFSGFALTKFSVDVANVLAETSRVAPGHRGSFPLINIDGLPLHSPQRQFFSEFVKQCWRAEMTADQAAGTYGTVFVAFGTYPVPGCALLTERGELVLNTGP